MPEGNFPTQSTLSITRNRTQQANDPTNITGLAIGFNNDLTGVAVSFLGFAESDMPPNAVNGQVYPITVCVSGITQAISNGAIAVGNRLTLGTGSKVQVAAANQYVVGIALSATTAANQNVLVLISREGVVV